MYRLGELSERQRTRLGLSALLLGVVMLSAGVFLNHFAHFPDFETIDGVDVAVVIEPINWVPRGWQWETLGHLIAFAGSQFALLGACLLWVLNQKTTWARAAFAAFLAWIELVLIFGIVPSEWLNLAQTDLDWSKERIFLTIPSWLVLGNEVRISGAALKDMISGGYHVVMLGAGAVFCLKLQEIGKKRPAALAAAQRTSPYGRPLVKGEG